MGAEKAEDLASGDLEGDASRAAIDRLLAGEDDQAAVAADLRAEAARAYDLLEGGLGAYGRSTAAARAGARPGQRGKRARSSRRA